MCLTQVGMPCFSDGKNLGLHGDISTAPAEDYNVDINLNSDIPQIIVKGKMRSGPLFGHNVWLYREIQVNYGENKVFIRDRVENRGYKRCPYMMLYCLSIIG